MKWSQDMISFRTAPLGTVLWTSYEKSEQRTTKIKDKRTVGYLDIYPWNE